MRTVVVRATRSLILWFPGDALGSGLVLIPKGATGELAWPLMDRKNSLAYFHGFPDNAATEHAGPPVRGLDTVVDWAVAWTIHLHKNAATDPETRPGAHCWTPWDAIEFVSVVEDKADAASEPAPAPTPPRTIEGELCFQRLYGENLAAYIGGKHLFYTIREFLGAGEMFAKTDSLGRVRITVERLEGEP